MLGDKPPGHGPHDGTAAMRELRDAVHSATGETFPVIILGETNSHRFHIIRYRVGPYELLDEAEMRSRMRTNHFSTVPGVSFCDALAFERKHNLNRTLVLGGYGVKDGIPTLYRRWFHPTLVRFHYVEGVPAS